jgi:hypothetical protein
MDDTVLQAHADIINKNYPNMNLLQLGMVVAMLGVLRSSMGHESAKSTLRDYISFDNLSPDVKQCLDFLRREVMGMNKSKIDIDYWKRGNKGEFRPE